jgi:hypothetical protein
VIIKVGTPVTVPVPVVPEKGEIAVLFPHLEPNPDDRNGPLGLPQFQGVPYVPYTVPGNQEEFHLSEGGDMAWLFLALPKRGYVDWQKNKYFMAYAEKLYQRNAPQLGKVQVLCDKSNKCVQYACENGIDFVTGPNNETKRGCILPPNCNLIVPIPSPPVNAPWAFVTQGATLAAESEGIPIKLIIKGGPYEQYGAYANWQWYDDYGKSVLGRASTWNFCLSNGDPGHPDPATCRDVQIRIPHLLPGTDGYPKLAPGLKFDDSFKDSAVIPDSFATGGNFCKDQPGANGHHCYKLNCAMDCNYAPSPGAFANESLWTVQQETGVKIEYFVQKYGLKNASFVHVFNSLEVPNSIAALGSEWLA